MKLISLFDGIGGFPLAWCHVTGQAPADLHYQSSEIEPWPMAVVRQRFPHVEELGDVTGIPNRYAECDQDDSPIPSEPPRAGDRGSGRCMPDTVSSSNVFRAGSSDTGCIITFGSPCQDLSVAGRGAGLAGERSGLFYEAMRLVRDIRPRYFVWENVAGAFSSNNGDDFAAVLRSTADIGYDAVWTTLDAQWCGVPQRRRRIFLLGVRDGIPAGADIFSFGRRATDLCRDKVQLIRQSRSRNPATSGEARPVAAALTDDGVGTCGADDNQAQAGHLVPANPDPVIMQPRYVRNGRGAPDVVSSPLDAEGGATSDKRQIVATTGDCTHALTTCPGVTEDGTGRGTPIVAEGGATSDKRQIVATGVAQTLQTTCNDYSRADGFNMITEITHAAPVAPSVTAGGPPYSGTGNEWVEAEAIVVAPIIRRLTPVECLRLQGFPDDWFEGVPGYSDTKAYRAVGNSVAIPCVEWIFQRVLEFDKAQE